MNGIVRSDRYDQIAFYMDTVRAISITDGKSWIEKIVKYEQTNRQEVYMITQNFNKNGELLSLQDSSYSCKSVSWNDIRFPCEENRPNRDIMYSRSEIINNTYFFTTNGHLYKNENNIDELYVEYKGYFEYKFGRGYYHPTLNFEGSKVAISYSE